MKKIVAFDIGGTAIKSAIFDDKGTLQEKWSFETPRQNGDLAVFEGLKAAIEEKGLKKDDILGIGIGVPGPVKDGVVEGAVNLGWEKVDVKKQLIEALGYDVPVFVGNDANIAAVGEYSRRSEPIRSMLFVTLGTGVGGGIVLEGTMHEGATGSGAEIGHMRMTDEGIQCNCGLYGCLETLTSATAVSRLMVEAIEKGAKSSIADIEYVNAKTVFDHAKNGDETALSVVDYVCDTLGDALAKINAVIDVPLILIGGGLSNAGEFLIHKVQASYEKNAFHATRGAEIKLAQLGNDAGIYGGAYLVMNHG